MEVVGGAVRGAVRGVMDVGWSKDRGTQQTCGRGQERDLDRMRTGPGWTWAGLEGISSHKIPGRIGTKARTRTFNRLYDLKYKSSIYFFSNYTFSPGLVLQGINPSHPARPARQVAKKHHHHLIQTSASPVMQFFCLSLLTPSSFAI